MEKKREVEEVKENANQAEGYVEAVKSGFHEIGDAEGEEKADEALEKISEIREYVKKRTEEKLEP
jgi:molecular chaperone DnaK (HSP70)